MGIVLRHEAAGVPFNRDNDRTKYGQALALQQRNDDNSTRRRFQNQQYETQQRYDNQDFLLNRDLGNNLADLDQAIAKGQFDPVIAKKLRQSLALEAEAMSNPGIDATQRAEALQIARAQRVPLLAMRRDATQEPTVGDQFNQRRYAEGGRQWLQNSKGDFDEITPQSQPQAPSTAREAFNQNPRMESDYLKMAEGYLRDPENPTAFPDRNALWDKAEELWGVDQMRRRGPAPAQSTMPANDGPMVPPSRPVTGSSQYVGKQFAEGQGVLPPSRGAQASTGKGYIFIKPSGKSVTQSVGMPSAPPAAVSPANPWEGVVSPTGQPMTADTQYDMQNLDRSPGINFFDPNNPAYAAMRAPQMQQPQAAPQYAGQSGLGGVNFGINQGTGNNVSASVRPGGTMLQYDEPYSVRPPVTDEDFKKYRKAPASPGEMASAQDAFREQQAAATQSAAARDSFFTERLNEAENPDKKSEIKAFQDFVSQGQPPEIENAIMVGLNPNSTDDEKKKAIAILRAKGVSLKDILSRAYPKADGIGVVPISDDANRQLVRQPKY
jgi:hypothetical protein